MKSRTKIGAVVGLVTSAGLLLGLWAVDGTASVDERSDRNTPALDEPSRGAGEGGWAKRGQPDESGAAGSAADPGRTERDPAPSPPGQRRSRSSERGREDGANSPLDSAWNWLFGDEDHSPGVAGSPAESAPGPRHGSDGGAPPPDREVALIRNANIRGRVVGLDTGDGVADAEVAVAQGGFGSTLVGATVRSDEHGSFLLNTVPTGRFSIRVSASGYRRRVMSGLEAGSTDQLLVELSSEGGARTEFSGIGVTLRWTGDHALVRRVFSGGAREAGVQHGDAIVAVDGWSTSELAFAEVLERIRGPEGSEVTLTVVRNGERFELAVRRTVIAI